MILPSDIHRYIKESQDFPTQNPGARIISDLKKESESCDSLLLIPDYF